MNDDILTLRDKSSSSMDQLGSKQAKLIMGPKVIAGLRKPKYGQNNAIHIMDSSYYGTEGDLAFKVKDSTKPPTSNLDVLKQRVSNSLERANQQVNVNNVFMYDGDSKTPKQRMEDQKHSASFKQTLLRSSKELVSKKRNKNEIQPKDNQGYRKMQRSLTGLNLKV